MLFRSEIAALSDKEFQNLVNVSVKNNYQPYNLLHGMSKENNIDINSNELQHLLLSILKSYNSFYNVTLPKINDKKFGKIFMKWFEFFHMDDVIDISKLKINEANGIVNQEFLVSDIKKIIERSKKGLITTETNKLLYGMYALYYALLEVLNEEVEILKPNKIK